MPNRPNDLVALRVDYLAKESDLGTHAQIIQQKTGKTVRFELAAQTRHALMEWINRSPPAGANR